MHRVAEVVQRPLQVMQRILQLAQRPLQVMQRLLQLVQRVLEVVQRPVYLLQWIFEVVQRLLQLMQRMFDINKRLFGDFKSPIPMGDAICNRVIPVSVIAPFGIYLDPTSDSGMGYPPKKSRK